MSKEIFSSLTNLTLTYMALIPISSTFLRQIFNSCRSLIGLNSIRVGLSVSILALVISFFIWAYKNNILWYRIANVVLYAFAIYLYLDIAEERFHVFEFGLLGFLLTRDLKSFSVFLPLSIGFLWGGVDELVQAALPYRVGELRDVGINALCVMIGVGLSLVIRTARPVETNRQNPP